MPSGSAAGASLLIPAACWRQLDAAGPTWRATLAEVLLAGHDDVALRVAVPCISIACIAGC